MGDERISQSGADRHVLTVGGIEYEYGPLTIGLMAKVLAWARGVVLQRANEAVEESGLEPTAPLVQAIISEAVRKTSRMTTTDPDFVGIVGTTDGTLRIVWMAIRDQKGQTFPSFCEAAWSSPESMRAVYSALEVAAKGTPFQVTRNES